MSGTKNAGVPLRWVVVGALVLVVGTALGSVVYFRQLSAALYEDAPAAVEEVAPDPARVAAVRAAIAEVQKGGGEVQIDEADWNRLLYGPALEDPDRQMRVRFEEPFVRLQFSQRDRDGGRYLNGALLAQLYCSDEALGLLVRTGTVGSVSIAGTEGEWARTRLERQLENELAAAPHLTNLFAGLRAVKLEGARAVLSYRRAGN